MATSIEASINLDNKAVTKSADKIAADFLENVGNTLSGNKHGDREEWVETVHKHFATAFPSHGIMVIHKGQDVIAPASNSYKKFHLEFKKFFGTEGFEIYVVKRGSGTVITNLGDGGFINWRFSGAANRDGKTVTF